MCGGKPALYKTKGWGRVYACHLGHATTGECDSEEAARIEWNTRPIEDSLSAQLAAARVEIERLRAQIAEYIENNPILRDWTGEEEDKAWEGLGTHGSNATEVTFVGVIGSGSTHPVVHHYEGDSDSEEYHE